MRTAHDCERHFPIKETLVDWLLLAGFPEALFLDISLPFASTT